MNRLQTLPPHLKDGTLAAIQYVIAKQAVCNHRGRYRRRIRMIWEKRMYSLSDIEFRRRYKITRHRFRHLCGQLRPLLYPQNRGRHKIKVEIQLSMTLRFLAGGHYLDIIDAHGVLSPETFYTILANTLKAIDTVVTWPGITTQGTMKEVSQGWSDYSNGAFQGCLGAIDGIAIKVAKPSEVENPACYFNRKGFFALNVQVSLKYHIIHCMSFVAPLSVFISLFL